MSADLGECQALLLLTDLSWIFGSQLLVVVGKCLHPLTETGRVLQFRFEVGGAE